MTLVSVSNMFDVLCYMKSIVQVTVMTLAVPSISFNVESVMHLCRIELQNIFAKSKNRNYRISEL